MGWVGWRGGLGGQRQFRNVQKQLQIAAHCGNKNILQILFTPFKYFSFCKKKKNSIFDLNLEFYEKK